MHFVFFSKVYDKQVVKEMLMATDIGFIEYVSEQIEGGGEIHSRKMFGEYMVYINNKPLLLVCDNTVYIKSMNA